MNENNIVCQRVHKTEEIANDVIISVNELLTAIENVSRGKNTTQSGTFGNRTSDKAVDGDYSTTDLQRCAVLRSPRYTSDVHWEVDLGGLHAIVSVTIYNTDVLPGNT